MSEFFGDRLGFCVGIEGRAEEGDCFRCRRGGEGHEELIVIMFADDLGNPFLLIFTLGSGIFDVCFFGCSERHTNRGPHPAFLRTVRLIDEKRDA